MKKWVLFPNANMLSIVNNRNKEMSLLEQRGKGQGIWEKLRATRTYQHKKTHQDFISEKMVTISWSGK